MFTRLFEFLKIILVRLLQLLGLRKKHRRRHKISLLVPFKADYSERAEIWEWLREYWEHELPEAEIVMGTDNRVPFSKAAAVNDAARKAKGSIYVILDADAYLPGHVIRHCAKKIREADERGQHLWFIPYRRFYRLTRAVSSAVLGSDPRDPLRLPCPVPPYMVEGQESSGIGKGHFYGALIQIMPRKAFEIVGGMDSRMRSWGGEDISFVRALDTLYGLHKTTDTDVAHLWHEKIGKTFRDRQWEGADKARNNGWLSVQYYRARGDRKAMRELVDQFLENRHANNCLCYDCRP